MRALPICFLAIMLSGCSVLSRSPVEPAESTAISSQNHAEKTKPEHTLSPVTLYTNAEGLLGKTFRDLGEVSGDACQTSNQDSPASIPAARKRLQINAAKMKANAALVHKCEIVSGTPGCYRQAVCIGSALQVSSQ